MTYRRLILGTSMTKNDNNKINNIFTSPRRIMDLSKAYSLKSEDMETSTREAWTSGHYTWKDWVVCVFDELSY